MVEQRDQVVAHLQQYSAAYQTLVSEREQLHKQYLQQCQLLDRLQHDESHGRTQLEISHNQLKQAQVRFTSGLRACEAKKLFNSHLLVLNTGAFGKVSQGQRAAEG